MANWLFNFRVGFCCITDDNLWRPTRRAKEHYTKNKLSTRRGAVHSIGGLCSTGLRRTFDLFDENISDSCHLGALSHAARHQRVDNFDQSLFTHRRYVTPFYRSDIAIVLLLKGFQVPQLPSTRRTLARRRVDPESALFVPESLLRSREEELLPAPATAEGRVDVPMPWADRKVLATDVRFDRRQVVNVQGSREEMGRHFTRIGFAETVEHWVPLAA